MYFLGCKLIICVVIKMAESERGRGGFRRRKFYINRDKDKERHGRGDRRKEIKILKEEEKEMKTPVILMRPKTDVDKLEAPIHPTILLKARDGDSRTVSPNPPSSPMPKISEKSAASNYQIATKSPAIPDLCSLTLCSKSMKSSVPLIGETSFREDLMEYLADQPDYLVVGVIGAAGVGKTMTLNRLVKPKIDAKNVFANANNQGLNAFMTSVRVLLIDSPPIPQASLDWAAKANSSTAIMDLLESERDRLSLQYTAFLMSVCHIVILLLANDNKQNESVIKYLLAVELMKPRTSAQGPDSNEVILYWPQLLIVHNNCSPDEFSLNNINMLQEKYRQLFENSKMQLETGMGIATGTVLPIVRPEFCSCDPINLFLLPFMETKAELKNLETYRGHLGYHDLICKLRMQLFAAELLPLTVTILTEKSWLHYAMKIWDNTRKTLKYPDYFFQKQPSCLPQ